MAIDLSLEGLTALFKEKIAELQEEPEFQWSTHEKNYATDEQGEACVKLAVGNVPLDYDLWRGLRNPAVVGLYPAGLQEIWEFYANRKRERVDESGRGTIFKVPRSFDFARNHYGRAVLVSVMLPFSPKVIGDYAQIIGENKRGSSHVYSRMFEDVDLILDRATSRAAMDLVAGDTVAVGMVNKVVKDISSEAIPLTRQGSSHGPCKCVNYPQKSLAALLGLGQLSVCRIVIRDELVDGEVQRFVGPLKSVVVFDRNDLVMDGSDGVVQLTESWREVLSKLFDFTNTDSDVNQYRFCAYIPHGDDGCTECVSHCPSGAQASSAPTSEGAYSSKISKQTHRFWEGKLQFDHARCLSERTQMTSMFPEWSCSRCVSMCAAVGSRRSYAAKHYQDKMLELTRG